MPIKRTKRKRNAFAECTTNFKIAEFRETAINLE